MLNQTNQFLLSCIKLISILSIVLSQSVHAAETNDPNNLNNEVSKEGQFENKRSFAEYFVTLVVPDESLNDEQAIQHIIDNWHAGLIPMALETMRFMRNESHVDKLTELINQDLHIEGGRNFQQEYQLLWNDQSFEADPSYHQFKALFYKNIDPHFEKYFLDRESSTTIRLDEVQWGGVLQDGIPPLRNPEMISANKATYLADDDIVFGIEINGDARAYPKRILAWHEMFTDTIGGVEVAGVYCTLCGTVIPFKTRLDGTQYDLGTSGFLYRSNKLMYDKKTQSLWSTTQGKPVIGPLVGQEIQLDYESVVTTTWGEWKKRNPETSVLSLNTGHQRDYGEGVAYNQYFSTDALMFRTPFNDTRLKNKQEILALRFPAAPNQQLAIDTDFLKNTPLYKNRIGAQEFIVLTDTTGANRVYDPSGIEFTSYDGNAIATDNSGKQWQVSESNLTADNGQTLERLPYHRAFWFGWHAAYPETKLIK